MGLETLGGHYYTYLSLLGYLHALRKAHKLVARTTANACHTNQQGGEPVSTANRDFYMWCCTTFDIL